MAGRRKVKRDRFDPQRQKVYNWEHQFRTIRTGAPLTSGRLHRLVRKIAKHYRIPKPSLVFKSSLPTDTIAQAGTTEIEFSMKWVGHTPLVVAHEMAHIIQQQLGMYPRHSWHGRQFAGILIYVLHEFGVMPASASMASMNQGKVRYYHPHYCRPVGLRTWYKKKKR